MSSDFTQNPMNKSGAVSTRPGRHFFITGEEKSALIDELIEDNNPDLSQKQGELPEASNIPRQLENIESQSEDTE